MAAKPTGRSLPLDGAWSVIRLQTADDETFALTPDTDGTDDAGAPEPPLSPRHLFPSSMGMSLFVPASMKTLKVTVRWGDYANDAHPRGRPRGPGERADLRPRGRVEGPLVPLAEDPEGSPALPEAASQDASTRSRATCPARTA